jgi:hypothetical protein
MEGCVRLGAVLSYQGDAVQAIPILEEGLMLAQRQGDTQNTAILQAMLAHNLLRQQESERAVALLHESIIHLQRIQGKWFLVYPLLELATVAHLREQPLRTARLLGAAKALGDATGTPLHGAPQAWYDELVATVRTHLGEHDFHQAWAEGRAMTLEQAIAYALEEGTH